MCYALLICLWNWFRYNIEDFAIHTYESHWSVIFVSSNVSSFDINVTMAS